MKEKVYITGHKNPDTDSICSAIAYADFKNSTGDIDAIPVRLGDINRETKFILDYFGVEVPKLMETVRLSVEDLNYDKIAPISPEISLRMALDIMRKNGTNSVPVVDENERLIGMISASDVIKTYIDVWDNTIIGKSGATVDNIIDTLSAEPIHIGDKISSRGKIILLAMKSESISDYLEEGDIVIAGDREDVQRIALENSISVLIITGNKDVDEGIVKLAKEKNISLILTPHDSFTTSRLMTQSIPVKYAMTKNDLIYFAEDELVDDIRVHMSQTRYRSYPIVNHDDKVLGMISRYHLISSRKKKVILVDHNERSQSIDGLEDAEILEIIDHHRVADVFTGTPIYFRNEPVGSTATIIGSIMFENGRRPSRKIAGILSAAITSDTLLLRSPTSTATDEMMLERLSRIADLDIDDFAKKMFKAGTSLKGKTPSELLSQDFKRFTVDDEKLGIAQVFTMDLDSLESMKSELMESMERLKSEKGYSLFILMLTDIFKEASEIVVVGEDAALIAAAFEKDIEDGSFYTPGVVSRKKQVVPPITSAIMNRSEY